MYYGYYGNCGSCGLPHGYRRNPGEEEDPLDDDESRLSKALRAPQPNDWTITFSFDMTTAIDDSSGKPKEVVTDFDTKVDISGYEGAACNTIMDFATEEFGTVTEAEFKPEALEGPEIVEEEKEYEEEMAPRPRQKSPFTQRTSPIAKQGPRRKRRGEQEGQKEQDRSGEANRRWNPWGRNRRRGNPHPMFAAMQEEAFNESPYAWVITKDLLGDDEEGTRGPRGVTLTETEIKSHLNKQKFRMLDDDGEPYYEGYFVDLGGDGSGFEPLDDFGMPNAGCTEIQYWESGKGGGWKAL